MDKRNDLNRYGFCDRVPYKSACENIKDYLDEKFKNVGGVDESEVKSTIKNTINESMSCVRRDIRDVDHHLAHVEHHVIDEIHEHSGGCCGCCGGVSEENIETIVQSINQHMDEKFDETKVQFSDLNQQVADLMDKLNG